MEKRKVNKKEREGRVIWKRRKRKEKEGEHKGIRWNRSKEEINKKREI